METFAIQNIDRQGADESQIFRDCWEPPLQKYPMAGRSGLASYSSSRAAPGVSRRSQATKKAAKPPAPLCQALSLRCGPSSVPVCWLCCWLPAVAWPPSVRPSSISRPSSAQSVPCLQNFHRSRAPRTARQAAPVASARRIGTRAR